MIPLKYFLVHKSKIFFVFNKIYSTILVAIGEADHLHGYVYIYNSSSYYIEYMQREQVSQQRYRSVCTQKSAR